MKPKAKGAVFWLMPARIKLKAIGGLLKGRGPKKVVQPAVANPEEMGYSGLYAAILSNVSLQCMHFCVAGTMHHCSSYTFCFSGFYVHVL